eukprot:2602081-Rhodomonas_salina.4
MSLPGPSPQTQSSPISAPSLSKWGGGPSVQLIRLSPRRPESLSRPEEGAGLGGAEGRVPRYPGY